MYETIVLLGPTSKLLSRSMLFLKRSNCQSHSEVPTCIFRLRQSFSRTIVKASSQLRALWAMLKYWSLIYCSQSQSLVCRTKVLMTQLIRRVISSSIAGVQERLSEGGGVRAARMAEGVGTSVSSMQLVVQEQRRVQSWYQCYYGLWKRESPSCLQSSTARHRCWGTEACQQYCFRIYRVIFQFLLPTSSASGSWARSKFRMADSLKGVLVTFRQGQRPQTVSARSRYCRSLLFLHSYLKLSRSNRARCAARGSKLMREAVRMVSSSRMRRGCGGDIERTLKMLLRRRTRSRTTMACCGGKEEGSSDTSNGWRLFVFSMSLPSCWMRWSMAPQDTIMGRLSQESNNLSKRVE